MSKAPKIFETLSDTYSTTGVVGEGGSGRVFAVTDSTGSTFALKCLFPHLITAQKRKRFKNEIDFCFKHSHPNIIQVLDSGLVEWEGVKVPFYVMPLLRSTLRRLLGEGIPHTRVLPLFGQILAGVDAAHRFGVVHRDLKPENILYELELDHVVVADFGIAHFEEELLATAVETKPSERLLNINYSAPEQRVKGAAVDERTDIYALGLILNELFTGIVPQGTGYKTIRAAGPDFAYLDTIIERMIQQDPDARPPSIERVQMDLIGHRNAFIALQELDATRQQVVPVNKPGRVAPVRLIGADWKSGVLSLQLDRAPEPGWVQRFQDPKTGYSFVGSSSPAHFRFIGNSATVQASDNQVQAVVDNFKTYLEMATRGYQQDVDATAQRREQEQRQRLQAEVAEAERRDRLLKNLKL